MLFGAAVFVNSLQQFDMPMNLSYCGGVNEALFTIDRFYQMNSPDLPKFKTICGRIGLNIPVGNHWTWDEKHHHALVVFDKEDLELILLPIALEFEQTWDFNTIDESSRRISDFIQSGFGLMPGQNLFIAADEAASGIWLYATCWPWGDGANFSLRVGLFSENVYSLNPKCAKNLLIDWLAIEDV